MAKKTKLGIQETKGQFQLKGIVTRTESDKFFKEITTQNNKEMRMVNFGIEYDKGKTVFIDLNGMEQDKVYFMKTEKTDDGKNKYITKDVPWSQRNTFNEEGYRIIGTHLGITKVMNEKGDNVNLKKVLHSYDACKEIKDNLKDGLSVFVKGNIEYSHFEQNGQNRNSTKFVPNQISLCKPVDFENEDFEPEALFQQTIIFMDIKPNEQKNKYYVTAKIVTYNSIEDAEFVITNSNLATLFKKKLKPYTGILVYGYINSEKIVEDVQTEDYWGEANAMKKIKDQYVREMVITGADSTSIETETWSESNIDAAIAKMNENQQVNKEWGSSVKLSDNDNDEDIDELW